MKRTTLFILLKEEDKIRTVLLLLNVGWHIH